MEQNNLDTLRILFIVKAVLSLLTTIFFMVVFLGMGSFIAQDINGLENAQEDLPFDPITLIGSLGIFAVLIMLGLTVITFLGAKYIGERRNHTFILVVSILNLTTGVLGLALGVFALIEINKPDVKGLFSGKSIASGKV